MGIDVPGMGPICTSGSEPGVISARLPFTRPISMVREKVFLL